MSMSISSTGNFSSIPSYSEMNSFSDGLKGASTQDLLGALSKSGAEPWQKDAILKELQNRATEGSKANGDNGGAGDSQDDIQKLLKKRKNWPACRASIRTHWKRSRAKAAPVAATPTSRAVDTPARDRPCSRSCLPRDAGGHGAGATPRRHASEMPLCQASCVTLRPLTFSRRQEMTATPLLHQLPEMSQQYQCRRQARLPQRQFAYQRDRVAWHIAGEYCVVDAEQVAVQLQQAQQHGFPCLLRQPADIAVQQHAVRRQHAAVEQLELGIVGGNDGRLVGYARLRNAEFGT